MLRLLKKRIARVAGASTATVESHARAGHATSRASQERILECMLIVVCLGLAALLHVVVGYKFVVLNLFYLPVVLAAFFLGRLRAGTLALFCVLLATVVAVRDLPSFAPDTAPLIVGLSLLVWAAVMGLNALLVGTLSDERDGTLAELNQANQGVVEVLAQYLKSADRELNDRASRVATLSQSVARRLQLSGEEVNDIRIAALLRGINQIEVTTQVIQRAFGDLSRDVPAEPHTFHGRDLVRSVGAVLTNALPLIVRPSHDLELPFAGGQGGITEIPFGAAIIDAAHRFDTLVYDPQEPCPASEAIELMQSELDGDFHPAVLHALSQTIMDLPRRATQRLDLLERLVEMDGITQA